MTTVASNNRKKKVGVKISRRDPTIYLGLVFLISLFFASRYNYLLFHSLAEIFGIIISMAIFMFAWNTRRFLKNDYLLFLGIGYFFVAHMDMLHVLTYRGMNIIMGFDTNLPTQIWIATRYIESITLLVAPFFLSKRLKAYVCFTIFFLVAVLTLLSIFYWQNFPTCFIEGVGLTPFKNISEYIISLFFITALIFLYQRKQYLSPYIFRLIVASLLLSVCSEFLFTLYQDAYGLSNLLGHYFKIVSFYCIYKAIIATGLNEPYDFMFRSLIKSEQTLLDARDQLEERVNERTAKFFQANKQLQQEIRERKLAEKDLVQAKEEWERTFDSIGDIVTIQDKDLRISRVNKQACEVFSASPDELKGTTSCELFLGRPHKCDECPFLLAKNKREVVIMDMENKKLKKLFQVTVSPVLDSSGQVVSIINFAKDITEQRYLERQLRQAQKMEAIGTLSGGIAHDFNNILTPILGYSELVLEKIPADNQLSSHIKAILQGANRAKDLVKQILAFSRQAEQEKQPLKVQFVIKEALKLLRASIPSSIEIRENINASCGPVLADPTQIHQIIINLCTNAYYAMRDEGGVLKVTLSEENLCANDLKTKPNLEPGLYAKLEVSDTGHGMNKIILERIFDPYFTTKPKGEGTGLGLSVVHGILSSMNGDISVKSKPGKGTVFTVLLPIVELGAATQQAQMIDQDLPTGKERIMVVDDEQVIADLEEKMLSSLGYTVTGFSNSTEALDAFQATPDQFDLLITDMNMPNLTGDKLAHSILKVRPDLPIILCTGFSDQIYLEKAAEIGIDKVLMKPLLKRELSEAVRKLLDEFTES